MRLSNEICISTLRLSGDGMELVEALRARGVAAYISDGTKVSAYADIEHAPAVLDAFSRALRARQ